MTGVKKEEAREKPSAQLDVRKTLERIKKRWVEAKSQSPPTGTKIRESSEGDEKPAPKTNDPFLVLRKFPRLGKRERGPHKWFTR
jgi:hypothetical protein